jgi:D-lactate dehydrogenase
LIAELGAIVGSRYVLTGERETRRYRTGFRFGGGKALAVVRPGSLVELWRAVNACARARTIMIVQAAIPA